MIEPTRKLTTKELAVFNRVLHSWPDDYFHSADAILLTHYAHFCAELDKAITARDIDRVVQLGTAILNYATKFRLTPHARYDPKTTHRAAERGRENEAGDDSLLGGRAWQH